jgi:peptidyl-prolyl cis-trans isomerase B (cyclophilin B)
MTQVPPAAPAPSGQAKTNTLSIIALIASLVQCIPIVSPIVAVILGHIAMKQIKERSEGGRTLAIIALILGYLGLVVWIVVLVTGGLGAIFGDWQTESAPY